MAFLLRVFTDGPGLTLRALAAKAGVSLGVLRPGYESTMGADTIGKIAQAASALLPVELEKLERWLGGGEDRDSIALQAWLAELLHLIQCTKCTDWFPESEIILALSRCRPCHRDENRDRVFQRRLAKDPELQRYYAAVEAAMPNIRKQDPDLHAALASLKGQAITRPKLGRVMGIPPRQVLVRLLAVGLSEILVALTLGRAQTQPPVSLDVGAAGLWQAVDPPRTGAAAHRPLV